MKTSLRSMLLVLLLNLAIGTCMQGEAPPPPAPPEWLYHYTSKDNFVEIIKNGQLRPSDDGLRGPGVYFTELTPDSTDRTLLENNYDGQLDGQAKNVEYAVAIRREDLPCEKLEGGGARGRNIWIIKAQNDPYLKRPVVASLPIHELQYKTFCRGDGNSASQAFKAEREIQLRFLEQANTIRQLQERVVQLESRTIQAQSNAANSNPSQQLSNSSQPQQQSDPSQSASQQSSAPVSYPEVIEVSGRKGYNSCINGVYYLDTSEKYNGRHMWKRRDTVGGYILLIRCESVHNKWVIHRGHDPDWSYRACANGDVLEPTQATGWMVWDCDTAALRADPAVRALVVRAQ